MLAAPALLVALSVSASQQPILEGQTLPALELPEVASGELVALDDFRGRKLLLIEFASW